MSAFEFAKFLHVLAVITWVGGAFFIVTMGFRMASAEPPHRIAFARHALFMGTRVFVPSIVVALAAGIFMVLDSNDLYTFDETWIALGIGMLIISAGIGTGFILPKTREALARAEAGDGAATAAIMGRVSIAGRINAVVLLVAVWAMVFRPGA